MARKRCWHCEPVRDVDKDGWACLLQDLRRRGATHVDLIVTDGHEGLLAAVKALFSATPRQCCLVHKQRNVLRKGGSGGDGCCTFPSIDRTARITLVKSDS